MNEYYTHKDEEGIVRPLHDMKSAEGRYGEIAKELMEKDTKKCGCVIIKVKLEEI